MKRLALKPATPCRTFAVEPLETRVLPSGVSPIPIPVSKASFVDADGDKVSLKMKGGDKFVIQLQGGATDNADVDTITVVAGKLGVYDLFAVLTVKVKPGKFSGGITEIGSLTMFDAPGTETLGGLVFNNALVNNISLPGNLTSLTANATDFGNVQITGSLGKVVIGNHDLTGTISANSIGTITNIGSLAAGDIAGNIISTTNITSILTNRITGSITAGGTIGTVATVEDIDGTVEATGGTLTGIIGGNIDGSVIVNGGNIILGSITQSRIGGDVTGTVHADGTLAIHAGGDFEAGASISSGGNMVAKANSIQTDLTSTGGNIQFAMKTGGLTSTITAQGNVTGDGSGSAIVIRNGNLSGQIRSIAGNIADVTMVPDTGFGITGSIIANTGNIGNLTFLKKSGNNYISSNFLNGATIQAGGNIGNVSIAHDGTDGGVSSAILNTTISAGGNIGTLTVVQLNGESAIDQSAISANGNIGAVDLTTTGSGSAIKGIALLPTVSAGGTIAAITARSVTGDAISTARFVAGLGITSVTAIATSGDAIDGSSFSVTSGSIGNIAGTSEDGRGIDNSTFQASANVGAITGTSGSGEGINDSTFVAGATMGAITGTSTGESSTADAIAGSLFTSGTTMGGIVGVATLGSGISDSKFSAGGDLASIAGTTANEDTASNKDGIQNTVVRSHGSIGRITAGTGVDDNDLAGATESEAIDGSVFSAFVNILATIGNSIQTSGDIQNSTFLAGYDIGSNLVLDGLAGSGSDDTKGDPATPAVIGDIQVGSDIVASFFAAGVGTDNAIIGDGVVDALDDFLIATGSSIGNITVEGVIAGEGGFIAIDPLLKLGPRAAFSADQIGLITAQAIGMSDTTATGAASVASVGISTEFFKGAGVVGSIEGIVVDTSTREQAIGDGMLVTTATFLGSLTATNSFESARSAIGTGYYGSFFLLNGHIGDITASTPNSPTAVAIDGRGTVDLPGDTFGVTFSYALGAEGNNLGIGNIVASAMDQADVVAIQSASFLANLSAIGTITTQGDIVGSQFGLVLGGILFVTQDIASIEEGTGITVNGNIIDSAFQSALSIASEGGINVNVNNGSGGYVDGSTFQGLGNSGAKNLGVGDMVIAGHDANGAGLVNSFLLANPLEPAAVNIGSVSVTSGSIVTTEISANGDVAMTGGIFAFGNTITKDFAIADTTVTASLSLPPGSIGSITTGPAGLAKDTVGTAISNSHFTGDNIAFGIDGHGTEDTADDTTRAIIVHGNDTNTTLSIVDSSFTATPPLILGSIGDILIAQSNGDLAGGGIENSQFNAKQHLGNIKVTIHVTDSNEDVSAISNSTFEGQSLSLDGKSEFGSIGDIVAILTGVPSTMDVISNSTFNAGPEKNAGEVFSLGNVTVSTQGSGRSVANSTFRADGDMGTLTLDASSSTEDSVVNSVFSAFGSIGSGSGNDIDIQGNVVGSRFLAGYDIGADIVFDGNPLLSNAEGATPGTERVNVSAVHINRVSVNGNFISSDLIAGIDPGDDVFGNSLALQLDANGAPLPGPASNDTVASADSRIGSVQVEGGVFNQGNDPLSHAIAAGFIAQFQQPSNVSHGSELPGYLDNGGGANDVRIEGEPGGAPVFLTSRDLAGREIDFDLDNNPDLIMLDQTSGKLKIFFGNGTGGFSEPDVFNVGPSPVGAVVGAFRMVDEGGNIVARRDADGNIIFDGSGNPLPVLSIVVLNSTSDTRVGGFNSIDVFIGDEVTGRFSDDAAHHFVESLGVGGQTFSSIAASDWVDTTLSNSATGDGFLDLVVTNRGGNTVRLMKNAGTGHFTANTPNNFAVGTSPTGISATPPLNGNFTGAPDYNIDASTDLNGQPAVFGPDIVTANSGSDNVSILFGNSTGTGTGQFSGAVTVAVGDTPLQTILSDVDNDNDIDILVVNFGSGNVTVITNDGLGVFTATATIDTGAGARSIIVGNFDGDAFMDFATANFTDGTVSVVLNTDGIYTGATASNIGTNIAPMYITSADYNNDGRVDLAVSNALNAQAPVVFLNSTVTPGTFTQL